MATAIDTVASQSALLKRVYDKGYIDALPEREELTKLIAAGQMEKIGREFVSMVNLTTGHSVSAQGDKDQNLSLPIPVNTPPQNTTATAYVYVYRDIISATVLNRAPDEGAQAFSSAIGFAVERAQRSFTKIVEEQLNYGQLGLGQFTAATSDLNNSQITMLLAEFAPGIWIGAKDMPIDIYDANANLILQTAISKMANLETRVIVLNSVAGLVNGTTYTIWRRGFRGLEAPGLQQILVNNTSLYGIDATGTFDLWTPAIHSAGNSSLIFSVVARGVAKNRPRGLGQNLKLIVSEDAFIDAIPDYNSTTETSANPGARVSRIFNSSGDVMKLLHGSQELTYKINSTSVEIMSSSFQKNGYAPLIEVDSFRRVGSISKAFQFQELGLSLAGGGGSNYFRALDNISAYEFRLMSDMALYGPERSHNMIFNNIVVNTAV
jgi:hypothetical protein